MSIMGIAVVSSTSSSWDEFSVRLCGLLSELLFTDNRIRTNASSVDLPKEEKEQLPKAAAALGALASYVAGFGVAGNVVDQPATLKSDVPEVVAQVAGEILRASWRLGTSSGQEYNTAILCACHVLGQVAMLRKEFINAYVWFSKAKELLEINGSYGLLYAMLLFERARSRNLVLGAQNALPDQEVQSDMRIALSLLMKEQGGEALALRVMESLSRVELELSHIEVAEQVLRDAEKFAQANNLGETPEFAAIHLQKVALEIWRGNVVAAVENLAQLYDFLRETYWKGIWWVLEFITPYRQLKAKVAQMAQP